MQISTRFILVGTQHGENVGAAARAMKTMGFADLALVGARDARVLGRQKVVQRASGATDVLQRARAYASLEEAVADRTVVCGTGMPCAMFRHGKGPGPGARDHADPRAFFAALLGGDRGEELPLRLALVFGSERRGLAEEDLDRCDVLLGVPTNPAFGSLNLAAAVQVLAYDWRVALGGHASYGDAWETAAGRPARAVPASGGARPPSSA